MFSVFTKDQTLLQLVTKFGINLSKEKPEIKWSNTNQLPKSTSAGYNTPWESCRVCRKTYLLEAVSTVCHLWHFPVCSAGTHPAAPPVPTNARHDRINFAASSCCLRSRWTPARSPSWSARTLSRRTPRRRHSPSARIDMRKRRRHYSCSPPPLLRCKGVCVCVCVCVRACIAG